MASSCPPAHSCVPEKSAVNLPSGLGARHAAAAALSAFTSSLAVVVSQSTGSVTLFKGGGLVMSMEKPGPPEIPKQY